MTSSQPVTVVVAEDDDEDFELFRLALKKAQAGNPVLRMRDGEELMDFLLRRGERQAPPEAPFPLLILLDLRMPRKDGWETLKEIKSHPRLKRIPVVVLTTSNEEADIARCYDLGCNSYLRKPVGMDRLLAVVQAVKTYWLEAVEFPDGGKVI